MKLDAAPWSLGTMARKGGKQLAWITIALWTGFTFAGYFTPIRELAGASLSMDLGPWQAFWVLFYAFATWGNAGFMREQVCKYMCPYARFQSAMFDRDTLIISYDAKRGEPRGARLRKGDPAASAQGACVDCGLCVQVCPTGIDIRRGLQYECIGCAACIDACDTMMSKIGQPAGLVRYDTLNGMQRGLSAAERMRRLLRPRVLVYGAVLLLISAAVGVSLAMRTPFKVDIVRDRSTLARLVDDGWVENVYRLQVMNATEATQRYAVQASGLDGLALPAPMTLELGPAEARWAVVSLRVPPQTAAAVPSGAHPIAFSIAQLDATGAAAHSLNEKSTFILPR
jgi:cytochrome c oxidase accessory protein FixG